MSEYTSPYAYRLPPDTFLYRRDPRWYIGEPLTDSGRRELLVASAASALAGMRKKLDELINAQFSVSSLAGKAAVTVAVPGVGMVFLPAFANAVQARSFLTAARDKIMVVGGKTLSPLEAVSNVARDMSISAEEAERRITEFLKAYGEDIDAQMKLSKDSAGVFSNTWETFKKALKEVTKEVADAVLPKDEQIPAWAWAAGGLVGLVAVAYIVGKVKS